MGNRVLLGRLCLILGIASILSLSGCVSQKTRWIGDERSSASGAIFPGTTLEWPDNNNKKAIAWGAEEAACVGKEGKSLFTEVCARTAGGESKEICSNGLVELQPGSYQVSFHGSGSANAMLQSSMTNIAVTVEANRIYYPQCRGNSVTIESGNYQYDPETTVLKTRFGNMQSGDKKTPLPPTKEQIASKAKEAAERLERARRSEQLAEEFATIKGGCFMMGSLDTEPKRSWDEGPQHEVCVKNFALGKYEVTQGQWRAIMGNNPSRFNNCGDDCPVEQVSWNDVKEFIRKLNAKTGKTYRLPSEAEWEYAARAGTTSAFYTGECINTDQANYDGNYDYNNCGAKTGKNRQATNKVGSFPANAFGLYDMSGNVKELVEDSYHDNYDGAPADGSAWQGDGARRVLRGGSWLSWPMEVRSAKRDGREVASWNDYGDIGFRLARTLP